MRMRTINNDDINIGNAADDAIDLQGATGITGNSLTVGTTVTNLNSGTTNVSDGATLNVNSDAVNIGDEDTDVIGIQGATTLTGNSTALNATSTTINSGLIGVGTDDTDDVSINAEIQGATPLILEGGTDDTFETRIAVTNPTADRTITLPDADGTVVLQGNTNYTGDLALTTDVNGDIVEAVDGQAFNVNSDVINLGNAGTDQVDVAGNLDANAGLDVDGGTFTIANGVNTTVGDGTITTGAGQVDFGGNVDANAGLDVTGLLQADDNVTLGATNADALVVNANADFNDVVNVDGNTTLNSNVTIADGATSTTINNDDINIGNAADDAIDLQGATGITGNSLTVGTTVTNLNSGTTNVSDGATLNVNSDAVNIGDEDTDVIGIQGATTLTGNSTALNATSTTINSGLIGVGTDDTDDVSINAEIQGATPLILEGGTDDTFETRIAVTNPTADRTITLPDADGTVVLQGNTNYTGDLALTTDVNGDIVEAVDGQAFNVNSDVINLGNAGTDQVDVAGNLDANAGLDVDGGTFTIANGVNTTVGDGTITTGAGQVDFGGNVDANAGLDVTGLLQADDNVTLGATNADALVVNANADFNDVVNVDGNTTLNSNVTIADGATSTTINNDDINIGNAADDAIDLQGATGITGNSLTVGTTVTNLNSGTTNVSDGATLNVNSDAVNIGDEDTDVIGIQGATTLTGNSTALNATSTTINSGLIGVGTDDTDDVSINAEIQGATPLILEGGTDDTFETRIAVTNPTADRTITLPDADGTVVLQGNTNYTGDLALTTDVNGDIVEAVDGQAFNVNSDVINLGNAGTDQVDVAGNLDANAGLDVDGGTFTIANGVNTTVGDGTITTGAGQVDFGGNVDANAGLDVTGLLQADDNVTLGATNADALVVNANADFNDVVNVDGNTTLNSNVTIADGSYIYDDQQR